MAAGFASPSGGSRECLRSGDEGARAGVRGSGPVCACPVGSPSHSALCYADSKCVCARDTRVTSGPPAHYRVTGLAGVSNRSKL